MYEIYWNHDYYWKEIDDKIQKGRIQAQLEYDNQQKTFVPTMKRLWRDIVAFMDIEEWIGWR